MALPTSVRMIFPTLIMSLSLGTMAQMDDLGEDDLECILEPNTEIEASAAVEGVLSDVLVQRGDQVKKGQALAKLISGQERALVELARARVAFGERKSVRNEELYVQKVISNHEKDEMDTELLISKLQLKQAEEQLRMRTVYSTIDGVVVERDKDPGEYVENESLLTLVSLDPLHVEVVAPAERFGTISLGMRAHVSTLGPMAATYEANVTLIDQLIDAASGTIRIRLSLPNPGNTIPAGLRCYVRFLAE